VSGSYAPIPTDKEIPAGMVHVGWYCTARGRSSDQPDGCIKTFADVEGDPDDGEVWLYDANHHGSWAPIYVKRDDAW
jgi:hypothetical protein